MLFSFVLPAYKKKYFKTAIESILGQSYHDFELVVINDASPEDLEGVVKSFDDTRLHYYLNINNLGGG